MSVHQPHHQRPPSQNSLSWCKFPRKGRREEEHGRDVWPLLFASRGPSRLATSRSLAFRAGLCSRSNWKKKKGVWGECSLWCWYLLAGKHRHVFHVATSLFIAHPRFPRAWYCTGSTLHHYSLPTLYWDLLRTPKNFQKAPSSCIEAQQIFWIVKKKNANQSMFSATQTQQNVVFLF